MALHSEHYEKIEDAVGEDVYKEVFAPIRARYAQKYLKLYLDSARQESEIAKEEFAEIMGAVDLMQLND